MRSAIFFVVLLGFCGAAVAQQTLDLMPLPAKAEVRSGSFNIEQTVAVRIEGPSDPALERAVKRFVAGLERQTGMPIAYRNATTPADAKYNVRVAAALKPVIQLGDDESYKLDVTAESVRIEAATTNGALRGLSTLLQLARQGERGWIFPAIAIQDQPRFPWRGVLIDSCRHWMPMGVIKRTLDAMEAVKLNVLHWHLSEDQGFRVESKKFPKLHQMGSDGDYYTQEQIKEIIAYARDRGIRVVPEFDMPGHTTAWFVGHPELASAPGPYAIERKWGIFDPSMDPTKETTYKFLEGFIAEMAALFPDQFFHIGGDEVTGKPWTANPQIQAYMKQHGLKDNHDLQAHFNQRVQKIVAKNGKTMVGWDEIQHPSLPKDIVIHSWRGPKGLAAAASGGYRTLLSNGFYMDLVFPAEDHYKVEPFSGDAAGMSAEEQKRVLGGEACMWAEYISPETIDSRLWPRTGAVAERLWSPKDVRDVDSMYARLKWLGAFLTRHGMKHDTNFVPMLQRIANAKDVHALKTVAEIVEPVKEYRRGQLGKYTQQTPLNRLIDAARPESLAGRDFSRAVDRILAGSPAADDEAMVRALLKAWQEQQPVLQEQAKNSFLLQEVLPISADLAQIGKMGRQALEFRQKGAMPPAGWVDEQLKTLEQAKPPKASVLNMAVAPVEKLVRSLQK